MSFYADTELDNDIRYMKELFVRYSETCKGLEENFVKLNKKVSGRICFISSQFKNLLKHEQMNDIM